MLILDATTKSLEIDLAGAVSANELPVTAHYTDITTTLYTPGSNDTQTNGATAVTIVAAPAASTQRHVESISVYNADTAAATVTIQLNNNSTLRIITKVTLQPGETFFYEDGIGWQILDYSGNVQKIADATLSGAPVVMTVNSDGTPYYFKAYPTKA
jgi:hypothetical protein